MKSHLPYKNKLTQEEKESIGIVDKSVEEYQPIEIINVAEVRAIQGFNSPDEKFESEDELKVMPYEAVRILMVLHGNNVNYAIENDEIRKQVHAYIGKPKLDNNFKDERVFKSFLAAVGWLRSRAREIYPSFDEAKEILS